MHAARLAFACAVLLLGACAGNPPAVSDSRWPFDTVRGMYGGNEFQSRSPEGKITYEGEKKPTSAQASPLAAGQPASAATVPVPMASAAPVAPATVAMAAPAATAPADEAQRITIDPNAFAAVFSTANAPVRPSTDQLMQLDALAMVAAEPTRTQLQQQILACRHAGSHCVLTRP